MGDVTMKDLQSLQGFVNKKIADVEKRIADLDKKLTDQVKALEKRDQNVSDSANKEVGADRKRVDVVVADVKRLFDLSNEQAKIINQHTEAINKK